MTHFRTALKPAILLFLISNLALFAGTGLITTVAGTGISGSAGVGGPATDAQLSSPVGLCSDAAGNLYIADYNNNRVVRVDALSGILTLVAGAGSGGDTGDGGAASLAALNGPLGLAMDAAGNLYISEFNASRIRKVDTQTGIITTVAAGIYSPVGLAFDASGNLYFAEYGHNVKRVDAVTGLISTVLANGPGGASNPSWLAFDRSGNLLISDSGYYEILRLNLTTGTFDVFAGHLSPTFDGDGIPATSSSVGPRPVAIAVDPAGNVYLAGADQYRIRRVDAATGVISTVAGTGAAQASGPDGLPANNIPISPQGLAIAPDGSLLFSDVLYPYSRVRSVSLPSPWTYTATSMAFNPATASPGQSLTFTATPVPIGGSGTPTGTVAFMDPSSRQVIGSADLSAGTATFTTTAPTASGTYHLLAAYSGDSNFAASVSPDTVLTVQTGPPATTVSLTSSANPSIFGDQVNFAATITISGGSTFTPTGTMQIKDAGAVVLTAPVSGTGVWFTLPLAIGTHPLTAVYSGDSNFPGSTSSVLNQVVNPATLTVSISSSANPAAPGAPVTFTSSVSAGATGVVEFIEIAAPAIGSLGTVPLVNGTATLTVPSLPLGTHAIQAYYHGDATHDSKYSAVLNQEIINRPAAVISLSSSMNPGIMGIQFDIAVTVTAPGGSSGVPTGSVQLLDGSTPLGTVNLTSGQAHFPVSFNTTGTHPLTAIYAGDANFGGVTSQPFSEVVKYQTRFWKTTSTPSPGIAGSPITITAYIVETAATGAVEFVDGINGPNISLGVGTLTNGTASIITSVLTAGTHEIYATYSGDANYISVASPSSLVVKAPATTVLTAAPAAPAYGQAVQLTASVPAAATGSVQFLDGANELGTALVNSGTAVLSVPSLPAGSHSISAVYSGDATYAGSTSSVVALTIAKAGAAISVSSSQNPAPSGQSITFTIALTPANTTGSVQLLDGATVLATLSAGATTASVTLGAGLHSVTAVYSGDANFNGATSAAVSQVVTTTTTTTVSADLPTSTYGQTVRLTAAVAPSPTGGTVQFLDGGTALGTATVQSGAASLSVSTLSVGTHSITAVYSGDGAAYLGSTSAGFTETVGKASTTATVAASPNPATAGQTVTLTAAVSPASATGSIEFLDGANVLGTVPVSNGAASLSTSALAPGSHSITVVYSGDTNNSASTSAAVTETITKAATISTLATSPNPATVGQPVTLSGAVSPSTATGTMQFLDGATLLGTVALTNGAASMSTSALAAGSHLLTVAYSGDATNSASTSAAVTETVNKAATTTTLTSSLNPAVSGQTVTFTAQASPASATGNIQFKDGNTLLGTVTLSSGAASLAVSSLLVGTHSITAIYSGDGNYTGSTSAALTQTVTAAIPGAPTNLIATASSSSQINLAWAASPTGGVTYNVYSSTASGFTPSAANRIATGVTATAYSHTGLAPSTAHYYLVTAQNSAGESAISNPAGATTLASGAACQVVYTVTTQWDVGFGTAITIKNTGSTPINGWTLTWKWPGNQRITQAWNSSYAQNGKNASLTNLGWNPTIAPGGTLSGMGFNASYSGTNAAPTAFYVNGTLCQ